MRTHSPIYYPTISMRFYERWQAKFVLSTYPVQVVGFTLIELSIVLVIIGLLAGGVLVGQDLIHAAQLRKVTTEFEILETATNTFRLKFNALPGDYNKAETIWGSDSNCPNTAYNTTRKEATCNGNSNKLIADANNRLERYRFFQHLANAELIKGEYTGAQGPTGASDAVADLNIYASDVRNGGISITGFKSVIGPYLWGEYIGTILMYGRDRNQNNEGYDWAVLTPQEAHNIDKKMDDGLPGKGKIQVINGLTRTYCDSTPCDCASTTDPNTATYVLSNKDYDCTLYKEIMP